MSDVNDQLIDGLQAAAHFVCFSRAAEGALPAIIGLDSGTGRINLYGCGDLL